ncbi:uncharacterized protein RCO7_14294 [Rhynchosporium graminicola]|uniref:Uncharacterized protein n=1 Tax=Rhynchosporium graminicola TaxID=2792576 RepID=A0A1E1KAW0_9HELO|nr:uncharacterized protein RCO7_14294 [Rhynchosporium commune]
MSVKSLDSETSPRSSDFSDSPDSRNTSSTPPSSENSFSIPEYLSTSQLATAKVSLIDSAVVQLRRSARFRCFFKCQLRGLRLPAREDDERLSLHECPSDKGHDHDGGLGKMIRRRASFDVMPKSPCQSVWGYVRPTRFKKRLSGERLTAEERGKFMTCGYLQCFHLG